MIPRSPRDSEFRKNVLWASQDGTNQSHFNEAEGTSLEWSGLGLEKIPETIPKNVVSLELSRNSLRSLSGLGVAQCLRKVTATNNHLQSLEGIESLSQLEILNCCQNRLKMIPQLSQLVFLQELNLAQNLLSAEACVALTSCHSLRRLDLSENQLQHIPDLRTLENLQVMELSGNSLYSLQLFDQSVAPFPPSLTVLGLDYNSLSTFGDFKTLAVTSSLMAIKVKGNPCVQEAESRGIQVEAFFHFLLPKLQMIEGKPIKESALRASSTLFRDSTGQLNPMLHQQLHPSNHSNLMAYLQQHCPTEAPPIVTEDAQVTGAAKKPAMARKSLASLLAEPGGAAPAAKKISLASLLAERTKASDNTLATNPFAGPLNNISSPRAPGSLSDTSRIAPQAETPVDGFHTTADLKYLSPPLEGDSNMVEIQNGNLNVKQGTSFPSTDVFETREKPAPQNRGNQHFEIGFHAIKDIPKRSSPLQFPQSRGPTLEDFHRLQNEVESLKALIEQMQEWECERNDAERAEQSGRQRARWASSKSAPMFAQGTFGASPSNSPTPSPKKHRALFSDADSELAAELHQRFPSARSLALHLIEQLPLSSEMAPVKNLKFKRGSLIWLVLRLQAWARGNKVRNFMKKAHLLERSSIIIQAAHRGHCARKKIKSLLEKESKEIQEAAHQSSLEKRIEDLERRINLQDACINSKLPSLEKRIELLQSERRESQVRERKLKAALQMLWREVNSKSQSQASGNFLPQHETCQNHT